MTSPALSWDCPTCGGCGVEVQGAALGVIVSNGCPTCEKVKELVRAASEKAWLLGYADGMMRSASLHDNAFEESKRPAPDNPYRPAPKGDHRGG